ncbi:MAG: replication-associated recombination protein A [Chloroflexota bacterium]
MTPTRPLADRIRPTTLDDFIGQAHLVGPGKPLRLALENQNLRSMIFWGPPGVGKTTLARILAAATDREYVELSAVSAGKKDLATLVERVKAPSQPTQRDLFSMNEPSRQSSGALLFLDEIHRFNRAQQDFLLPYVEDGTLVLIGATTENPSFEVISALLSRSQVFVLYALTPDEVARVIRQGADELRVAVADDAVGFLSTYANGDARKALNLLETTAGYYGNDITLQTLKDTLQSKQIRYDRSADEHYDTISAYIKSMRASQPDAALYYLARMVAGGEDPKFIARRMVIFASEDVGMADPHALTLANAVFRAVETVGMPEAGINLAHGTVYMAKAPKSRSAYNGYKTALAEVQESGNLPIPLGLRNAPTQLMQELGYGKPSGEFLPSQIDDVRFYDPD